MTEERIEKKKTPIWIFIVIGLVVIGAIVAILSTNAGKDRKVQKLLTEANKYLVAMDYEQAIAAFEEAIEIDPKCVDAYLGLADAYTGMEDYDKAIVVLKEAEAKCQDNDLKRINKAKEKIEELISNESGKSKTEDKSTTESEDSFNTGSDAEETQDIKEDKAESPELLQQEAEELAAIGLIRNLIQYTSYAHLTDEYRMEMIGLYYEYTGECGGYVEESQSYGIASGEMDVILNKFFGMNLSDISSDSGEYYFYKDGMYCFRVGDFGMTISLNNDFHDVKKVEDGKYTMDVDYSILYDDIMGEGEELVDYGTVTYLFAYDGSAYHIADASMESRYQGTTDNASTSSSKYTSEDAYNAVVNYCYAQNDSLADMEGDDDYTFYFYIDSETENACSVCYRSYTGAIQTYNVNLNTGIAEVSTYVPIMEITEDEGTVDLNGYF